MPFMPLVLLVVPMYLESCKTAGSATVKGSSESSNSDEVVDPKGRSVDLNGDFYVVWRPKTVLGDIGVSSRVIDKGDVNTFGVPAQWVPYSFESALEDWDILYKSDVLAVTHKDPNVPLYLRKTKLGFAFVQRSNGGNPLYGVNVKSSSSLETKRRAAAAAYADKFSKGLRDLGYKLGTSFELLKTPRGGRITSVVHINVPKVKPIGYGMEVTGPEDNSSRRTLVVGTYVNGIMNGQVVAHSPRADGSGYITRSGLYDHDNGFQGDIKETFPDNTEWAVHWDSAKVTSATPLQPPTNIADEHPEAEGPMIPDLIDFDAPGMEDTVLLPVNDARSDDPTFDDSSDAAPSDGENDSAPRSDSSDRKGGAR